MDKEKKELSIPNVAKEMEIDNFPPEILREILKCVDTPSIFGSCRLVSRKWHAIATKIAQHRPDFHLWFEFSGPTELCSSDDRPFAEFLECMKASKNSPYSRFSFSLDISTNPKDFFQHQDFLEFLSEFNQNKNQNQNENGNNIKFLGLNVHTLEHQNSFRSLIEELKDLLLKKLPNLEEFGLSFSTNIPNSEIRLFPAPTTKSKSKSKSNQKSQNKEIKVESSNFVQFPQLKRIHLPDALFSRFPGITRDLVEGAPNLKRIHLSEENSTLTIQTYRLLHSLGKLGLLNNVEIELEGNFLAEFVKFPNPFAGFHLEELELNTKSLVRNWDPHLQQNPYNPNPNPETLNHAANFISAILESNKNRLKRLRMNPCAFLPVQFPTAMRNLNELEIFEIEFVRNVAPFFPPEIRSSDIFNAVTFLSLHITNWAAAFPGEDSIPRLPQVQKLSVEESSLSELGISKLVLLCPNLKNLFVKKRRRGPELKLLEIGRCIWTKMTGLETLEMDLDLNLPENNPTALDSCFTGISLENCRRLLEVTEAKKTLEKWGFETNVSELELKAQAETQREFPSILDMKDLKQLTINPYSEEEQVDFSEFFQKLTWISKEFAFKLLPQLRVNEKDRRKKPTAEECNWAF